MSVTDPIGDMLTRIRNAMSVGHDSVKIPSSRMKVSLANILKNEGFVKDVEVREGDTPQGVISLSLNYDQNGESNINGLKRVSRPGLRVYVRKGEIPRYYGGLGIPILSTSRGVMTGKQAVHGGVGGELLCYVW